MSEIDFVTATDKKCGIKYSVAGEGKDPKGRMSLLKVITENAGIRTTYIVSSGNDLKDVYDPAVPESMNYLTRSVQEEDPKTHKLTKDANKVNDIEQDAFYNACILYGLLQDGPEKEYVEKFIATLWARARAEF